MVTTRVPRLAVLGLLSATAGVVDAPAFAQSAPSANGPAGQAVTQAPDDIVITARRRQESLMRAPVILQALGQQQIQDAHITRLTDLATTTPSLKVAYGFATSGITINLRGLGNGSGANFIDQSVGLNIDGASFSSGLFYRAGVFDLQQIEVLKGPQALFYGKSTSAGLIVLHTADPTRDWEGSVTSGYEIKADEFDLNGYVSGPLSQNLGIRIAGFRNRAKGYYKQANPANPARRLPATNEYGGRVTLKYDDGGVRANLKLAASHDHTPSYQGELNQTRCPTGKNPAYPFDDCKVNLVTLGHAPQPPYNPALDYSAGNPAAFALGSPSPIFRSRAHSETTARSGILNLEYDVASHLTLSSLTALGYAKAEDSGTSGTINLAEANRSKELTQELRLASDWQDSLVNFMVDGYYSRTARRDHFVLVIPRAGTVAGIGPIALFADNRLRLLTTIYSGFGQALITPTSKLELSAGLRYTHVDKRFTSLVTANNYPAAFRPGPSGETIQNVPHANRVFRQDNVSPELTLTYHPAENVTAFVSYKRGYKGPGFNAVLNATTFTGANVSPFGGEKVQGVEGGVKATLFDRQLALTASGYRYNYKGLQVSFNDRVTNIVTIAPAANARVQGIELGATLTPRMVTGLSLNAFVNYNDSYYTRFVAAPCYGNQPASAGCVTAPSGARTQDLTGRTLNMAPKWSGSLGASYKTALTNALDVSFDVGTQISSKYKFTPELHPLATQKGYATLDLALHLLADDKVWDAAIICRNCTDRHYFVNGLDGNASPGVISTVQGVIARPWQLLFQLTLRPSSF